MTVPGDFRVGEVSEVTPALIDALARLLPQLSDRTIAPSADELSEIVHGHSTVLFVAAPHASPEAVVGTLTLVLSVTPGGRSSRIEDVVVDKPFRNSGIAAALVEAALSRARSEHVRFVDLTSAPRRGEGAERLYLSAGFVRRDTNVYRYEL